MPYHHILVPLDANTPQGIELGHDALTHAVALAEKVGARVTVASVYAPTLFLGGDTLAGGGILVSDIEKEQRKRFDARLNKALDTFRDVQRVTLDLVASVPEVIADAASDLDADLIVMPSHGRTGVSRFLLGSVAERVARLAPVPVLLLKRQPHDDDEVALTPVPA